MEAPWPDHLPQGMYNRKELDSRYNDTHTKAIQKLHDWVEDAEVSIFEPNPISRLHKLNDAINAGELLNITTYEFEAPGLKNRQLHNIISGVMGTIVVTHDWHKVLGTEISESIGNDFVPPYPHCAFEFRMNDVTVILVMIQDGPDGKQASVPFFGYNDIWMCLSATTAMQSDRMNAIWLQVQAVCVALDAEVATISKTEPPAKLNKRRAKRGLTPLYSHSVVDLAKRYLKPHVVEEAKEDSGIRIRLHFRRGHWRHLDEKKVWVKWCLVGNPDLGFVDHYYKI